MEDPQLTYPITPVEIVLADGKARRLRYPAAALKRMAQARKRLAEDPAAPQIDLRAAILWHGLIDREGISKIECECGDGVEQCKCGSLFGLIDARAVNYLNERLGEALPKSKNPPVPASAR